MIKNAIFAVGLATIIVAAAHLVAWAVVEFPILEPDAVEPCSECNVPP
jgi:hypothetical protein